MTNIIAIAVITIITNGPTYSDNEVRQPNAFSWAFGEPQPGSVIEPATERKWTTDIIERTTVTAAFNGHKFRQSHDRLIERRVRVQRLKETWVDEPEKVETSRKEAE